MSILSILNEVAIDSSKLAKEAILRREVDNETLKRVFKGAYDPTINYWIKAIPHVGGNLGNMKLDVALAKLDSIINRTYTGNAALDYLEDILKQCSADDAEVIRRVVSRDLRIGCSESTANKVWKKLIPEFSYMRCSLSKQVDLASWDWTGGIYSQFKADGMFVNIDNYDDEVVVTSRAGTVIPNTQIMNVVDYVETNIEKGTRLHGEFLIQEGDKILPRELSNGIMNSIAKGGVGFKNKNQKVVCIVWDQIPISNGMSAETYHVTYEYRYSDLLEQLVPGDVSMVDTRVVYSLEDAMSHYAEVIGSGCEGTVIKTRTGKWKDTTSKDQVKLKLEVDVDLEVVDLVEGKGKNADTFGSVTVVTSDRQLSVDVSGFSDEMRQYIFTNFKSLNGTIMTVKSNSLMPPSGNKKTWSMFLPRFVELRTDKKVADSLQQVKDQFASAIKL